MVDLPSYSVFGAFGSDHKDAISLEGQAKQTKNGHFEYGLSGNRVGFFVIFVAVGVRREALARASTAFCAQ